MCRVTLDTLKSSIDNKKKKGWTFEWMPVSLFSPYNPPSSSSLPSSLSLSHGTRAHLAQPCRLNWIRHTRLFRHCAVAWESPGHLHEGRGEARHRQDLRVWDSQGWKRCGENEGPLWPARHRLRANRGAALVQGHHLICPIGAANSQLLGNSETPPAIVTGDISFKNCNKFDTGQ